MSESKAARRYAQALGELCDAAKNHDIVLGQLHALQRALAASDDLKKALAGPILPLEAKRDIAAKIGARLLFAPVTKNFVSVLLDHDRLADLDAILREVAVLMDRAAQRVRATVTTAVPLDKARWPHPGGASAADRQTVVVDARIDPAVLGGVITQIGSVVLDGSVRSDLAQIGEVLGG